MILMCEIELASLFNYLLLFTYVYSKDFITCGKYVTRSAFSSHKGIKSKLYQNMCHVSDIYIASSGLICFICMRCPPSPELLVTVVHVQYESKNIIMIDYVRLVVDLMYLIMYGLEWINR